MEGGGVGRRFLRRQGGFGKGLRGLGGWLRRRQAAFLVQGRQIAGLTSRFARRGPIALGCRGIRQGHGSLHGLHDQPELVRALGQGLFRQQHPLAEGIGLGHADRSAVVQHDQLGSGRCHAGDDGRAVLLDADHVDSRRLGLDRLRRPGALQGLEGVLDGRRAILPGVGGRCLGGRRLGLCVAGSGRPFRGRRELGRCRVPSGQEAQGQEQDRSGRPGRGGPGRGLPEHDLFGRRRLRPDGGCCCRACLGLGFADPDLVLLGRLGGGGRVTARRLALRRLDRRRRPVFGATEDLVDVLGDFVEQAELQDAGGRCGLARRAALGLGLGVLRLVARFVGGLAALRDVVVMALGQSVLAGRLGIVARRLGLRRLQGDNLRLALARRTGRRCAALAGEEVIREELEVL